MKKQIYGLIKYNYEINKKRNIFFKYYDFYLQEEKTISLKYFKDIQDYDFYPNRLNQKEMAHIIGTLNKYSLDEINSFFKQFFEVRSMSKRISHLVYDIKRNLYFENKESIYEMLEKKDYEKVMLKIISLFEEDDLEYLEYYNYYENKYDKLPYKNIPDTLNYISKKFNVKFRDSLPHYFCSTFDPPEDLPEHFNDKEKFDYSDYYPNLKDLIEGKNIDSVSDKQKKIKDILEEISLKMFLTKEQKEMLIRKSIFIGHISKEEQFNILLKLKEMGSEAEKNNYLNNL